MRKISILGFLVVIAVLACLGFWMWRSKSSPSSTSVRSSHRTAKVEMRDIEQVIYGRGEIAAPRTTEIKAEINGMVARLLVQPGTSVKKGDLLIELNRSELESQLNEATHQVQASQLRASKVKLDLSRKEQLMAKDFLPRKDYDEAKIDTALAENELEISRARLETLKQQLIKTSIHAPHDGVVLRVDVREGTVIVGAGSVSSGTVLMTVADLTTLEVRSDVNEIDVVNLKIGQPVSLSFDSIAGKKVEGEIRFISPSAVTKQDRNAVRVFPVTVGFTSDDPRIRVGISAKLSISLSKANHVAALPVSAVFMDDASNFVYLNEGLEGKRRDISVGIADANYLEIKSGIKDGDVVLLSGSDSKVKP